MKILMKEKNSEFPELTYGEKGREFSCLLTNDMEWQQINYGQGEGQFSLLNCEWGIYYDEGENLILELHEGEINCSDALNLASSIKGKIEKDYGVKLDMLFIG